MFLLQVLQDQHLNQDESSIDRGKDAFDGILLDVAILIEVGAILGVAVLVSMEVLVVRAGCVSVAAQGDATDLLLVPDGLEDHAVGTYRNTIRKSVFWIARN